MLCKNILDIQVLGTINKNNNEKRIQNRWQLKNIYPHQGLYHLD